MFKFNKEFSDMLFIVVKYVKITIIFCCTLKIKSELRKL